MLFLRNKKTDETLLFSDDFEVIEVPDGAILRIGDYSLLDLVASEPVTAAALEELSNNK